MEKNQILLILTDNWCDWEASYAIAVANSFSDYTVKTVALDRRPKTSMGGLRTEIDASISEIQSFDSVAIAILPGGLSWEQEEYCEIADFVHALADHSIPVAAICGATYFLCKHGFLNHIHHTGDSLEQFLEVPDYQGKALYVPAQVVVDGGFITANETAAVAFAYEIFKQIKLDNEEEMGQWFDNFQNGAVRS